MANERMNTLTKSNDLHRTTEWKGQKEEMKLKRERKNKKSTTPIKILFQQRISKEHVIMCVCVSVDESGVWLPFPFSKSLQLRTL